MPFSVNVDGCLIGNAGENVGLSTKDLEAGLQQLAPATRRLAQQRRDGTGPEFLQLPDRTEDLARAGEVAEALAANCDDVLILGTGGSSLGGQTLYALADSGYGNRLGGPNLHFLDNVDPDSFDDFLAAVDLSRLGVVAISKSGGTAETLCQTLQLLEALLSEVDESRLSRQVAVITEPKDSPLKTLAARYHLPCLDHDEGVGGRYSVLSVVGLLPALLAGLDAAALRRGAREVLDQSLGVEPAHTAAPQTGAVLTVAYAHRAGLTQTVLMPYIDRLAHFGLWFRQLWAESLGKQGKGLTPIRAMGAVDQHSQLQLYLEGPRDKFFTLVRHAEAPGDAKVPAEQAEALGLDYLAGHGMGDLLDAMARATTETLIRHRRPTRVITLNQLDETSLGGLLMHFMLETVFAAELLEVDPFDQPAVEEGKQLARQYLSQRTKSPA
ncbi:glucose-6-phosphate isomerase [Fodinicurvata sediminis]|uniref:glucose-6-phosphate isomerase n=1 Tax=Fodinicurvata sediminis TaxID=1121832 RepID=UPI0003B64F65|nr:glucose-6-phosphate isomerase [Fodinicurvata sediminis]